MISNPDKLCTAIGYCFKDPGLLRQALTHRSAGASNNERLEFLGDAFLGAIVAEMLYERFPGAREGRLSRLRATLVQKDSLAELARQFGLGEYLTLGSGELKTGGHSRNSTLADAMEAILGAVYLDGGYAEVLAVVRRMYTERMELLPDEGDEKDPKTRLQELLQGRRKPLPRYQVVSVSGDPHRQVFEVECSACGLNDTVRGSGSSRRRAEQDAASRALDALMSVSSS